MTHRLRLKLASYTFAVFWTVWMVWCLWPMRTIELATIAGGGALAGFVWYWLHGEWYCRYFVSRRFPRRQAN